MKSSLAKGLCIMCMMACSVSVLGQTVQLDEVPIKQEGTVMTLEEMYQLGKAYLFGLEEGVEQDVEKARDLFEEASNKGYGKATSMIAEMYDSKVYGKENVKESFKWYRKAALQGDAEGMYYTGMMYLTGRYVGKDTKNGLKWINKVAETTEKDADVWIGSIYQYPEFGVFDTKKAIEYYNKAIKKGNPKGYGYLGEMYLFGEGAKKDVTKAKEYFLKGAKLGDIISMTNLYNEYKSGTFGKVDNEEAYKWCKKGVELKQPWALIEYGKLYATGEKVPLNKELARKYFIEASKIDDYYIINSLIYCAITYDDYATNKESALAALGYYKKAANLGHPMSMIYVGIFYKNGFGVDKDLDEMHKWFEKAFNTKNREAIQYLIEQGYVQNQQ